jgi:hypothetical protein
MLISELMITALKSGVLDNQSKILIMEDIGANECCSLFRKMRRKIDNIAD